MSKQNKQQKAIWIGATTLAAIAFFFLIIGVGAQSREGGTSSPDELGDVEMGFTEAGLPYLGYPDALIKIVEYSDYGCGYCRDFSLGTKSKIVEEYVATGKVQFVQNYFALNQRTAFFVEAARCAADQNRYWEFNHLLFENYDRLRTIDSMESLLATLLDIADDAGLDKERFEGCWSSHKYYESIAASSMKGFEIGIEATPTFFVQDEKISGSQPFEVFKKVIDNALAREGDL